MTLHWIYEIHVCIFQPFFPFFFFFSGPFFFIWDRESVYFFYFRFIGNFRNKNFKFLFQGSIKLVTNAEICKYGAWWFWHEPFRDKSFPIRSVERSLGIPSVHCR